MTVMGTREKPRALKVSKKEVAGGQFIHITDSSVTTQKGRQLHVNQPAAFETYHQGVKSRQTRLPLCKGGSKVEIYTSSLVCA